ncbi:glucosaminidase domain-containing protein [Bowmanella dokdonensis]|uniref:Glucosaminidase domain-containing protein n=1 Tax=Bowmanella dokdonensis TaxID=751969 RepID=A0A939IQD6_9ALTE|nr:glucosaminidase domain-containing protein [Bowmanella dokdonensis]MBN7826830.1 glucosaminidase domain-containing protein [Bowmanella dokdonensis]
MPDHNQATTARKLLLPAAALLLLVPLLWLWSELDKEPVPDFAVYAAGNERKQAFFGYFQPLIEQRNREILALRQEILAMQARSSDLTRADRRLLTELADVYRIEDFNPASPASWDLLLRRVDIVPTSLALAQAANESAWGTSRFAREANNFYGQWCFAEGCGLVPKDRGEDMNHEVADFDSPRESVEAYIRNLNRHYAYQDLRRLRQQLRNSGQPITGLALSPGLTSYSERGEEYMQELRNMIRYNNLDKLDEPHLGPE